MQMLEVISRIYGSVNGVMAQEETLQLIESCRILEGLLPNGAILDGWQVTGGPRSFVVSHAELPHGIRVNESGILESLVEPETDDPPVDLRAR